MCRIKNLVLFLDIDLKVREVKEEFITQFGLLNVTCRYAEFCLCINTRNTDNETGSEFLSTTDWADVLSFGLCYIYWSKSAVRVLPSLLHLLQLGGLELLVDV